MSAFAAIFQRDRGPVSEETLAAMAQALAHRGPDGRRLTVDDGVGLAHLHAWVTPEEVGERQPLRSGSRALLFDGRLDNREELGDALADALGDAFSADTAQASDAQLVLAAHEVWGRGCCERLLGPFALALYEFERRTWLLARDPLGDRTLFYADAGESLLIASEECALLRHPAVSGELDEARLVHFFAGAVPSDGSTFFRGVHELPPGHLMEIDRAPSRSTRFWSPPADPSPPLARSDVDLAEEYLELLRLAVESRLRVRERPAVLMSGGLDSTSIASLAAAAQAEPRVVSWVFDRFAACDERSFIRPVAEMFGLDVLEVRGDDLGPNPVASGLGANPNSPEENPYRSLKSAAYAAALRAGSPTVLSGGSADVLYTGFERWLREAIVAGRPVAALLELGAEVRRSGARVALRRAGLTPRWRARRAPDWLTPWARSRLEAGRENAATAWPSARARAACGARAARSLSLEIFHAAQAGVDLRHPYRDLRLVEFMLRLPARQLYRDGRFKPIARRALAGRLPASVLDRTEPTRLTPLFDRAIRGAAIGRWRELLDSPGATWPRFVRADWVESALRRSAGPAGDVALWNCLSFELWRRSTIS